MVERKSEFNIPEDSKKTKGKSTKVEQPLRAKTSSFFDVFYDGEEEKADFHSPKNRKRFVSTVYAIITAQLVFTVVCTIPFVVLEEAKNLVYDNTWLIWVFLVILVVPYLMLVCCESTRMEFPTNTILLFFLTVGMAGISAFCSAWFETVAVLYTFILIVVITILITILSCVSARDYTSYRWIMVITIVFLTLFLFFAISLAVATQFRFATFMYPGILVAIFAAFLLHDINSIMGGHRIAHIGPKDYICGAAQLFVDIVGIFLWFLEIVGTPTDTD